MAELDVSTRQRWLKPAAVTVAVPLIVVVVLLLFAWPSARIAPRDLPLGVVGTGATAQHAVSGLEHAEPGAFDLTRFVDESGARHAIANRDVYGALVVSAGHLTILTATAASSTVAQQLAAIGGQVGDALGLPASAIATDDVVATSPDDPRGVVLGSAVLPLIICGIAVAAAVMLVLRLERAWQSGLALVVVSAAAALGAYLIAQGFLGALPHQHVATWAALAFVILATAATVAGFVSLLGTAGLGVGAATMVLVGNPFSGATSAPELLPQAVGHIGQWLPPGAGANLLRSTAYFDGHGAAGHLTVLALWSAAGLVTVLTRHPSRAVRREGAHEAG